MRPALLLISITALFACDLPSRDNGNDPLNRPVADLEFFDASPYDCDAQQVGTAVESILILDRGRCLGLSALESTDPQDERPAAYRFARLDGGNEVDLSGGFTASPVMILDVNAVRALPADVPLHFRLAVVDSSGTEVIVERELQIENGTPSLPHVASMTIPFGGYPWAASALPVHFASPASSDPNGDPDLTYSWTFEDGEEQDTNPNSPAFTRSLDVNSYAPYIAQFRVLDDAGRSTAIAPVVVTRRPRNVWTQTIDGFARIDGLLRSIPLTGATGTMRSHYFEPSGMTARTLVAYNRVGDRAIVAIPYPDLIPGVERSIPLDPATQYDAALSPAGDQVVMVETNQSTGVSTIRRMPYDGTTIGVPVNTSVAMPSEGVGLSPAVEHTLGAIWVSRRHENVYAVSATDGTLLDTFTDTLPFHGFALRPGSGELWLARSTDSGDPVLETAKLQRFTSVADPVTIDTGEARIRWLAWADADELWVVLDGETVLVDATVLDAGGTFDAAIVVRTQTSQDAVYATVDLSSGNLVVVPLPGTPQLVARNGTTRYVTPDGFPEYFDRLGAIWSARSAPTVSLVRSGLEGGQSSKVFFYAEAGATPDGQGGLWSGGGSLTGDYSAVVHIMEDGTISRRDETWIVNGVERPMPSFALFRLQPGTQAAWAHAVVPFDRSLGIYKLDLSTSPPIATLVLDSAQSEALNWESQPVLEPSSPTAASSFAWIYHNDTVAQLQENGQIIDAPAPLFDDNNVLWPARSILTNGLCIGSISDNGGTNPDFYRGRYFPNIAGFSESLIAGISVPNQTVAGPIAVSRDAAGTGDLCWFTYQEPTISVCNFGAARVVVYPSTSTSPLFNYSPSVAGRIRGVLPIDSTRFWVVLRRCDAAGADLDYLELVERNVSTGGFTTLVSIPNVDVRAFADWESSSNDSFLQPF